MRYYWSYLVLAATLSLRLCDNHPNSGSQSGSGETPPATSVQPRAATEDLSALRFQKGGYLQPPKNKRVIVFVNGIFGDAVSTWQSPRGVYWPGLLLSDTDFRDVDVYVHSFDSPKIDRAQRIEELAGRMRDFLEADKVLQTHEQVVFICHSMGGLVTRAYLLKEKPAPSKVPMIYFFSTPTTGANITEIARHLSGNPQLADMLPLKFDGYVGDLQNQWLGTSDDKALSYPTTISSFCAYEKLDTFGVRIVERQSATNLCNRETRGILASHIDIVKPPSDRGDSYIAFKAAYDRTFGPAATAIKAALAEQQKQPLSDLVQTTDIKPFTSKLALKRQKATREYLAVNCEETKTGDVLSQIELLPGERIIAVIPTIENTSNIADSSVALVRHDDNSATIHYSLRGLNKTLFGLNCPGGGHADVVANFVLSREAE